MGFLSFLCYALFAALIFVSTFAISHLLRARKYLLLAQRAEKAGNFAEAVNNYDKFLAKYRSARAYFGRGKAKNQLKQYSAALLDLDKALELDARACDVLGERATAKWFLSDFKGAIADYDRMIEKRPDDSFAIYRRGRIKYHANDLAGAKNDFETSIDKDPRFLPAHVSIGMILLKESRINESLTIANRVLETDSQLVEALLLRAQLYSLLKEYPNSLWDLNAAVRLAPNNALTFYRRGILRLYTEEPEKALTDFDTVLAIDPTIKEALLKRAMLRYNINLLDGALDDLNRAINIDPKFGKAYDMRGRVRQLKGDNEGAKVDFNTAISLLPSESDKNTDWEC